MRPTSLSVLTVNCFTLIKKSHVLLIPYLVLVLVLVLLINSLVVVVVVVVVVLLLLLLHLLSYLTHCKSCPSTFISCYATFSYIYLLNLQVDFPGILGKEHNIK